MERFGLTVVTAAAAYPITLAEALAHVRQESGIDDDYVNALIAAATAYAENYCGKRFITQTWDIKYDRFPCGRSEIELPYPPIASITSITYVDSGGTSTVLSSTLYTLDAAAFVSRLYPTFAQVWPATQDIQNAVVIRAVAGYGASGSYVPPPVLHAIKLMVGHWYEMRSPVVEGQLSEVPKTVDALLQQERAAWL